MQTAPKMQPEFLTLKGAAQCFDRMSPEVVRDWIIAGKLKGYKPGGRVIFVRRSELEALIDNSAR